MEFRTETGLWRVTDLGTRTVIAMKIDPVQTNRRTLTRAEAEAEGMFIGPPYGLAETVFDEDDIAAIEGPAVAWMDDPIWERLDPIILEGRHIEAIKEYRTARNENLARAKRAIEERIPVVIALKKAERDRIDQQIAALQDRQER